MNTGELGVSELCPDWKLRMGVEYYSHDQVKDMKL